MNITDKELAELNQAVQREAIERLFMRTKGYTRTTNQMQAASG